MEEKKKAHPILPIVNLVATILSPILEKRNAKKNEEKVANGELPKIEVSSGRIAQFGGSTMLLYWGYEIFQIHQVYGFWLMVAGSVLALGMEYLKGRQPQV